MPWAVEHTTQPFCFLELYWSAPLIMFPHIHWQACTSLVISFSRKWSGCVDRFTLHPSSQSSSVFADPIFSYIDEYRTRWLMTQDLKYKKIKFRQTLMYMLGFFAVWLLTCLLNPYLTVLITIIFSFKSIKLSFMKCFIFSMAIPRQMNGLLPLSRLLQVPNLPDRSG